MVLGRALIPEAGASDTNAHAKQKFGERTCVRIEPASELWECLHRVQWLRFVASSGSSTGWNGVGVGSVVVESPEAMVLTYSESGTWQPAIGPTTRFRNVFRWSIAGPELVRLEHLRFGQDHPVYLFDLIPSATGSWRSASPHLCREDCYSAELQPRGRGLSLHWLIAGPQKQESIAYEYRWEDSIAEPL